MDLPAMKRYALLVPFMFVVAVFLPGCPTTEKGASLSGTVSYQSKPVTGASMTLHYPDKTTHNIPVKPDGTFLASGVPPGNVKVTIDTEMIKKMASAPTIKPPKDSPAPPVPGAGAGGAPIYVQIPLKYADQAKTPLTWEFKDGSDKKDFVLAD